MKKNISISIGIPAYNEESNIAYLLELILKQKERDFYIKEIIVLSDGSVDRTVQKAGQIKDARIKIIADKKRKGKSSRVNELFKIAKADILVQLDADISIKDKNMLYKLVLPMLDSNSVDLVFGMCKPLLPKTFIERLTYFGFEVWDEARNSNRDKNDKYFSMGGIRAFSKNFRSKFRFPKDVSSVEDAYSYYYSKSHGFKIAYSRDAFIYIRLASSFRDYTRQMARTLNHSQKMLRYFDKKTVKSNESIGMKTMIKSLLKKSLKNPPYIPIGFVILHTFPKIYALFFRSTNLWEMASSTKKLR